MPNCDLVGDTDEGLGDIVGARNDISKATASRFVELRAGKGGGRELLPTDLGTTCGFGFGDDDLEGARGRGGVGGGS